MLRQVFHNQGVIYSPPWALDLNFLADKLDPRITASRPSADTRFNSTGQLETVAAGVPVFGYDPITLAALGLRGQEQRTNFFLNGFVASGGVIGSGPTTAPDGQPMRKFTVNAGAATFPNFGRSTVAISTPNGATQDIAFSGYFAASIPGSITLEPFIVIEVNNDDSTNRLYATFQINTSNWTVRTKGLVAGLTEVSSPTITQVRPGIYYVAWVVRYTQDASFRNRVASYVQARDTSGNGTFTADGVAALQYTYCVAELGGFPSESPIPSTTTQVTRAADVATMSIGSWFNSEEWTIYARFRHRRRSGFPAVFSIHDGTQNNRIALAATTDNGHRLSVIYGGVSQGAAISENYVSGSDTKVAAMLKARVLTLVVNGGSPVTLTPASIPSGLSFLSLACAPGIHELGGTLAQLRACRTGLPIAQLQALTR